MTITAEGSLAPLVAGDRATQGNVSKQEDCSIIAPVTVGVGHELPFAALIPNFPGTLKVGDEWRVRFLGRSLSVWLTSVFECMIRGQYFTGLIGRTIVVMRDVSFCSCWVPYITQAKFPSSSQ